VDFAHEMEKILVANFSVFELHLNAKGHAFGAFLLGLLGMHRIRTNTQKLKVVLPGWFQVIIHVAYISDSHNTYLKYNVMFFNVLDDTSITMSWRLSL
jgi:hypothetical protein